jgi:hypothetical protein
MKHQMNHTAAMLSNEHNKIGQVTFMLALLVAQGISSVDPQLSHFPAVVYLDGANPLSGGRPGNE